jgi:hypothetical protein
VDELERLAGGAEVEGGAEHRMARHGLLHRAAQAVLVERGTHPDAEHVVVDGGIRPQLGVEEHAALQAGQRIGVDNAFWETVALLRIDQRERPGIFRSGR